MARSPEEIVREANSEDRSLTDADRQEIRSSLDADKGCMATALVIGAASMLAIGLIQQLLT